MAEQRPAAEGQIPKLATWISGFDNITLGGLPEGRTTLLTGSTGTGKTVFAAQFLAEGAMRGEPGVFVTFEESAADLRRNFASLGWDVEEWEANDLWRFVDASPVVSGEDGTPGDYPFAALLAQIGEAVDHTGAERIALDSVNVALSQITHVPTARYYMHRLAVELRRLRMTGVLTVESAAAEHHTPPGFEQFVADNVVALRTIAEDGMRRRTIEVVKMRGTSHRKGEYSFTVLPNRGFVVIPLSVVELTQRSTLDRITSGNEAIDGMCSGGFFRDSVVLVSGATGTGKTLMATEFLAGGAENGERALLLAFEESHDQILRNALAWGRDFGRYEEEGNLRIVAMYPEVASLEDHLVEITREIEAFKPKRIVIDSLSALQRSGSSKGFREFLIVLTAFVKAEQLTALFTATTPALLGGTSITEAHVSTLTDSIILLRYVEAAGEVKRGIAVLKMRGSAHAKKIYEFTIDEGGLQLLDPFEKVTGILSGQPVHHGNA